MHVFAYVAAFLLLRQLRKYMLETPLGAKWGRTLNIASWSTLGIFIVSNQMFSDDAVDMIAALYLFGILAFVEKEPDFKPTPSWVQSFYPFAAVMALITVVQLFAQNFYNQWEDIFSMAMVGGFIYFIAVWASYKRGQKELEKERQKRISEEKEKQFISIKKTELEIIVASRTAELMVQKDELQKTIQELQTTQAQLIQQEKLASLGELTAGIAHEIQNPLSFVNNFSEVSAELLEELEEELKKGDTEEALALALDVKGNMQKINHHGKRADRIVKGMLQHSRANSGQKEPIDINVLVDEYMRLSYHGLRAKDNTFNAELVFDLAPELEKVQVVPQDLGRVLLNLCNNAFYAVQQKQKSAAAGYKPMVKASTRQEDKGIRIEIRDNGNGISEAIRNKILQPFFTAKPTGEGTGLGLSLSYDIITKGHDGELTIESEEGAYAAFIITLPLKNKGEKEAVTVLSEVK